MSTNSKIEWTDATWNPIVGCTKISPGCDLCYAERMAGRLAAMGQEKYSAVIQRITCLDDGAELSCWNGKTFLDEAALRLPLTWKKPRRIFVCSMGDLFHKSVPFEWIDRVMAIATLCPQHTFQILTKRPERMLEYFQIIQEFELTPGPGTDKVNRCQMIGMTLRGSRTPWLTKKDYDRKSDIGCAMQFSRVSPANWRLPNLWLGVTAENQEQADKRIPLLLQTPAAVRFVSIEPMLGPVDLRRYLETTWEVVPEDKVGDPMAGRIEPLDWVICGGETGPGARPMHPDWPRGLRDQCQAAKVPFFFKQLGEWKREASAGYWTGPKTRTYPDRGLAMLADGRICISEPSVREGFAANIKAGFRCNNPNGPGLVDRVIDGEALKEWHKAIEKRNALANAEKPIPPELERLVEGYEWLFRVGKKAAGRLLDGKEWNETPAVIERCEGKK